MTVKLTRFVLVRHGQTEWNRVERFRGREDLTLNEVGVRQAEAAARRIATTWSVAAIYTSPLRRALETAQIIAQALNLTAGPLEGLTDIDYGRWQGLSPQEAKERYADLYATWLRSPQAVQFPQGESLGQVRERVETCVLETARRHQGETVVLVGHQVVNKVMLCFVLGLDNSHFWHIEQATGAISVFEYREGIFVVTLLNDTCHLLSD